jgi:ketosteroid isomerase-like protein
MSRTINILLATTIFILSSCHSDDNGQAKKEELKNIVVDYYAALANKDLQKANSLTTDNFILFDEGRIYNNEAAIDSVKKMGPFTATFTIDSLNVHVDKKDASAYYFRKAEFSFPAGPKISVRFLESATFNKEGNKWKLRFMQSAVRK